jgi:PhnB protein
MKINPYITFNGRCEEAFDLYARVLGGRIEMKSTFREMPAEVGMPADWQDKIMHVSLRIGEDVLMGSDAPPGHFQQPQGFSVSVHPDNVEDGKRIFDALAEGGTVKMPFQETFWAQGFGMLDDRFGIPWMVNAGQKG